MARILILSPYGPSIIPFRGDLLEELVRRGHEVHAAAPEPGFEDALEAIGVRYWRVPLSRTGTNPLADLRGALGAIGLLRRLRPDILLAYAIKPIIYGSLAARFARVPAVFSVVTGLGSLFVDEGGKAGLLRTLALGLYRAALKRNQAVFFLNRDDKRFFEERGSLPRFARAVVLPSEGINLGRFAPAPPPSGPPAFLLLARLIRHKGIAEYAAAAASLKAKYPEARFRLLGPTDTNPSALSKEELRAWEAQGAIEYLGATEDPYAHLAACSVYVLPSYREGVPRSILEAMAVGRPIVTTDVPGCRETVVQGLNGFLVPPRDPRALAEAMERFIAEPRLIAEMGRESRRIAEEKFDVRKVNALILDAVIQWRIRRSVLEVPGFFWRAAYNIGGQRYSANDVEHGILRANANHPLLPGRPFGPNDPRRVHSLASVDPRVHFALVCASRSCPPVAVYTAEGVDEQLDQATRAFLRGGGVQVMPNLGRVRLSRLFRWYAVDFGALPLALGSKHRLLRFIARYLDDPNEKDFLLGSRPRVEFLPYDWSLNGQWGGMA